MIDKINAALLELQSAVLSRSLYPAGHPRIRWSEEKARSLLTEILSALPEITVFAVDDRVVCGEEILPSSPSLLHTLFELLRQRGVDQITLRTGLEPAELERFLDALAAPVAETPQLQESAHLTLGAILRGAGAPVTETTVTAEEAEALMAVQAAGALAGIWRGIHDSRQISASILGDVVSTLARGVSDSSCAILPLAVVKEFDEYTFVHIINVAILSISLAEALGFSGRTTHDLGIAALLHDVGKMAVPPEILNKKGRFTDEEFKAMQVHSAEGARMLLRTRGIPDLAPLVAYEHHVRFDGGGYPKVPPGWRLNLASRICQIADVYDALRTDRPYRKGMSVEKITRIMRGDAGSYFDRELLDIFLTRVLPRAEPVGESTHQTVPAP